MAEQSIDVSQEVKDEILQIMQGHGIKNEQLSICLTKEKQLKKFNSTIQHHRSSFKGSSMKESSHISIGNGPSFWAIYEDKNQLKFMMGILMNINLLLDGSIPVKVKSLESLSDIISQILSEDPDTYDVQNALIAMSSELVGAFTKTLSDLTFQNEQVNELQVQIDENSKGLIN